MDVPSGTAGKPSSHDVQRVQNRIEQCLQQYMNKKEVINTLITQENIDPQFTKLVWQRLEEENQEFFKAYYLKLLVKDQILEFNRLLTEQVKLMNQIGQSGITSMLSSNGLPIFPGQQMLTTCGPQTRRAVMQSGNTFTNSSSSAMQQNFDGPNLFMLPNSNVGLSNGKTIKPETGYTGCSPFDFRPSNLMGDAAAVSSFSTVDSSNQQQQQPLHDHPLLDGDSSPFGFLPHGFNLHELAADFSNGSDLLESYCRPPPPFIIPANGNHHFVDPQGDNERLMNHPQYQCFGGN